MTELSNKGRTMRVSCQAYNALCKSPHTIGSAEDKHVVY